MSQRDAPAFDFYPERWLVGTAAMSDAEQLSYLRLLCHQWTMDGLPEDVAILRRLAGKGVTDAVLAKFPVVDGKRRNARLEIVRQEQRQRIVKSREKIEKMNAARAASRGPSSASTRETTRPLLSASSPLTTHHPPHVLLEKEPKGAGEELPGIEGTDRQPRSNSRLPTTPAAMALAEMVHRKLTTPWSEQEIRQFKRLQPINQDDLETLTAYYAANWPPDREQNVLRHDLKTILNNFPGEVDRANTWKLRRQSASPPASKYGEAQPDKWKLTDDDDES